MSNDKFILATNGLYYTANILTTGATLQSSFTNGKLLRRIAGVTGGIAAYRTGTSTTYTDNFTAGLGAQTYFAAGIGADPADEYYGGGSGSYSASGGRTDAGCVVGEIADAPFTAEYSQSIFVDLGQDCLVTAVSMYHVQSTTAGGGLGVNIALMDNDFNIISNVVNATLSRSTTYRQATWSGSVAGVRYVRYGTVVNVPGASDPTYIDEISVTYAGRELLTSDDYGATVDTVQIGSTSTTVVPAFDTDDYNLGIAVCSSGVDIRYTTTYDQATATILDGLDGVNGTALITAIRVPYLKLATQADNSSASSLQFIYCTNSAVGGETIFAANVNVSTGAIVGTESTLTPVISATTYYVIGANAIEFFGGNTQIGLALCKPVGGGSTVLLATDDGGTTWENKATIDGTSVTFLPPTNGGTGQQAFICGSAIGVRYTSNRGATITNVSGDLNAETSSTAAIKAIAI